MNETKYEVKQTSRFKKDYRLAKKRGYDIQLLRDIVILLADGKPLPVNNHDHAFVGDWLGYRECHITGNWLLVYRIDDSVLVLTLTRTGTHSDLTF